jgi:hypothetical protein
VGSSVRVVLVRQLRPDGLPKAIAYVGIGEPWFTTVGEVDFTSVLGSNLLEFLVDVLDDELGSVLDTKVGNESDGEFTLDRAWDDGLGSWGGCWSVLDQMHRLRQLTESTLDTVKRKTWVPCVVRFRYSGRLWTNSFDP